MSQSKNCLIIKYSASYGKYDQEIDRCFVLNEEYTNKFKLAPINEFEMMYATSGGYDNDYLIIKKYFMKEITKETYNILKELYLVDDEDEIIEILDNK